MSVCEGEGGRGECAHVRVVSMVKGCNVCVHCVYALCAYDACMHVYTCMCTLCACVYAAHVYTMCVCTCICVHSVYARTCMLRMYA